MSQNEQCALRLCPNVLIQKVEDETVLLNVTTGRYFGLDPVATRCWEVYAATGSISDAVEQLRSEYDVDAAQLRADLESLFEELQQNELVEAYSR